MKLAFVRQGRAIAVAVFCAAALLIAVLCGRVERPVRSANVLTGKWTGNILWSAASGRDFDRKIRTSLFFEPSGATLIVLTLPSGNLGGIGAYTLNEGHLTIHCTGLTINGRLLPKTLFNREPWFHDTADYRVTFDGANLTLANPVAEDPTAAPGYPLLNSAKPIVLSRVETSVPAISEPAPKE